MAAVSLFWNTNMAAATSCENAQKATFKNTVRLLVYLSNFCISIVFIFTWDHCKSQEKLETTLLEKCGGQRKSIMVFLKVAYHVSQTNYKIPPVPIEEVVYQSLD